MSDDTKRGKAASPPPEVRVNIPTNEVILTPRELANDLQISMSTLQRLFRAGHLPHIRVGRQIRFRRSEVLSAFRTYTTPEKPRGDKK